MLRLIQRVQETIKSYVPLLSTFPPVWSQIIRPVCDGPYLMQLNLLYISIPQKPVIGNFSRSKNLDKEFSLIKLLEKGDSKV
jgi:hypothetical protein